MEILQLFRGDTIIVRYVITILLIFLTKLTLLQWKEAQRYRSHLLEFR